MTVRAILRVPEGRKRELFGVSRWIADVNGFTLEGEPSKHGDPIAILDYGDPAFVEEVPYTSTGLLIRIPFLGGPVPDSTTQPKNRSAETFAMNWVADRCRLSVRGPRIPVRGETILAFWERDSQAAVSMTKRSDKVTIEFGADVIGSVFNSLAQVEEHTAEERDPHGRFPQSETFAVRGGVLQFPIASDSALALGKALRTGCMVAGEPWVSKALWPDASRRIAAVSHDVDSIRKWTARRQLGVLAHAFRDRRAIGALGVGRRVFELVGQRLNRDPHRNLGTLRLLEAEAGVSATYFIQMSQGANRREPYAQYDWRNRYLHGQLKNLRASGHELALHASYESADRVELLKTEVDRLATFCRPQGVRQHYLRSNPVFDDAYRSNGLVYDSTVGYSEFVGFRSGACHPYAMTPDQSNYFSNPIEIPFAVMDSALDAMAPGDLPAMARILTELSEVVEEREGVFVSVWHNHFLDGALIRRGSVLDSLITRLTSRGWHFMTLVEIADWWVRRRDVQLSRLGPREWEIRSGSEIRNLAIRVTPASHVSVEGAPDHSWSVTTDERETVVTFLSLPAHTTVKMHTLGGAMA